MYEFRRVPSWLPIAVDRSEFLPHVRMQDGIENWGRTFLRHLRSDDSVVSPLLAEGYENEYEENFSRWAYSDFDESEHYRLEQKYWEWIVESGGFRFSEGDWNHAVENNVPLRSFYDFGTYETGIDDDYFYGERFADAQHAERYDIFDRYGDFDDDPFDDIDWPALEAYYKMRDWEVEENDREKLERAADENFCLAPRRQRAKGSGKLSGPMKRKKFHPRGGRGGKRHYFYGTWHKPLKRDARRHIRHASNSDVRAGREVTSVFRALL